MNIVIIGDGGVGSNLLPPLVKLLTNEKVNAHIKIIDGDKVETKNFIRQDFVGKDCGGYKVESTAKYIQSLIELLMSGLTVEPIPVFVKKDNVAEYILEGDIILVGVDNYKSRKIIDDYASTLKDVLVVYGGNEYSDGDVNITLVKGGEILTQYTKRHPEIQETDNAPDELNCMESYASAPQILIANITVALYMLEVVYQYIKQGKVLYKEKMFDLQTGNVRII
jgi:hypothetical protein